MMAKPEVAGRCGCGRSPTGVCCGWHALTEDMYRHQLMLYMEDQLRSDDEVHRDESDMIEHEKRINEELESYRQQAMNLWVADGGSCIGDKPPQ